MPIARGDSDRNLDGIVRLLVVGPLAIANGITPHLQLICCHPVRTGGVSLRYDSRHQHFASKADLYTETNHTNFTLSNYPSSIQDHRHGE